MKRQALHERIDIVPAHRNNYLFSRRTFGCHLDTWFWFGLAIDNVINLVNLLSVEGREHFFDFQYFQRVVGCFGGLSIRLARIVDITLNFVFNCRFIG